VSILVSGRRAVVAATALALLVAPRAAVAQGDSLSRGATPAAASAPPVAGPPVRRIATASALSIEPLGAITGVRELPDGRLLLNDGARRRLLLMDSTLRTVRVVLDSLAEVENTYGTRPGALIPYRGDSTLFVDPASYVMLVLDPQGRIARVRSVPSVQEVHWLTGQGGSSGVPGTDARGRLVYRISARAARPTGRGRRGVPWIPSEPDSAFIVAMDVESRTQDTLGTIRIPKTAYVTRQTSDGGVSVFNVINPLPSTDEWAVLPDGAVAFVRALDYRVDYLEPDGRWTSSPKLPFEWRRMSDADRERLVDSVRTVQRRSAVTTYVTSMIRWVNTYGKSYPAGFTIPEGYSLPLGFGRDWKLPPGASFPARYVFACAPGEEATMLGASPAESPDAPAGAPPPAPAAGAPAGASPGAPPRGAAPPSAGRPSCIPSPVAGNGGNPPPAPTLREPAVMDPAQLPSFRPPFGVGAVRADADGYLWIRPTPARPQPGGAVYDVVDRRGELTDRLQLPPGYALAGFGRGRVVYLSTRDASGVRLARVRLR
jgi:hypothetical protein